MFKYFPESLHIASAHYTPLHCEDMLSRGTDPYSSRNTYLRGPILITAAIDTWQIVVVIAGVDRISLSTGMKLMAREWYEHARHQRNFMIVLCDENPSEHVSTLPVYSWHHIPTVSSHLDVGYAADTSLCLVRLYHVYSIMQNYSTDMENTMESLCC